MKINSLHIASFGGIKNLDLTLSTPFNIIYGDNENGKTTIMSFIKMMFYGTERGSSQLSKNLRKKYTPWDQSAMAGSIDFENNGRSYRIERIFGSSNSTDKVTLIDLNLGERESVSADIGTKLFGLTSAAFERSIFIGQFGFPESNSLAEGELNGKLSNIALTGDEAISFDAVNQRLLNAKYELMSKSGRSGVYDKNLKAITEMQKELEKAQTTEETVKHAKQKALQLTEEIKLLNSKAEKLKAQIDSENDFRNAEKLKELLNLKAQLDELNQTLSLNDGTLADEMFVRKVEFCLSKVTDAQAKIEAKQNEVSLIENNLKLALNPVSDATPEKAQELTKKIKALEDEQTALGNKITALEQDPPKKASSTPFILAGIFGAIGIAATLWQIIAGIVGLAVAVIFVCMGIAGNNKLKSQADKTQSEILDLKLKQNGLISVIASEKSNLTAVTAALNSNSAMIENQKDLLLKGKEDLTTLKTEQEAQSKTLFELFAGFKATDSLEEIKSSLVSIKETAQKQKELKQNINYILKDVGNISYEEIKEKLNTIKTDLTIDFEVIKTEYENLLAVITERKTQVASILTEVKSLTAGNKNPETIKEELKVLTQKTAAQKDYCDSLDIALAALTDAYAEIRQSYGSVLEKKSAEIFAALTGGRYSNMSISKSFDIAVEEAVVFGAKELEYLSSGTQDQAYLSLRLALSSLMCEESGNLPIILDDALAQYDDTRAKTALEFLKEYSANGQVLMFTCHKSLVEISTSFDSNIINL